MYGNGIYTKYNTHNWQKILKFLGFMDAFYE